MFLAMYLNPRLELQWVEAGGALLIHGDADFRDICEEWAASMFLGFFDWLRSPGGEVVGVAVTLHDGREKVRNALPGRDYITWLSDDIVRIRFRPGDIDEHASVDQEFTTSRCLRAVNGDAALLFDVSGLSSSERSSLLG
jgi:hypothetical protein